MPPTCSQIGRSGDHFPHRLDPSPGRLAWVQTDGMDDAAARSVDLADALSGVRVGQWTDAAARTGCTVVLLPDGTVGSGEVRGGAPATREFDLLAPERLVDRVHAVVPVSYTHLTLPTILRV